MSHSCSMTCRSVFEFLLEGHPSEVQASGTHSSGDGADKATEDFPFFASEQFKKEVICEWQAKMHPGVLTLSPCAVCAQMPSSPGQCHHTFDT